MSEEGEEDDLPIQHQSYTETAAAVCSTFNISTADTDYTFRVEVDRHRLERYDNGIEAVYVDVIRPSPANGYTAEAFLKQRDIPEVVKRRVIRYVCTLVTLECL